MLNVYYNQVEEKNRTLNVSLSDNIGSHWSNGGLVLELSLYVPDFCGT